MKAFSLKLLTLLMLLINLLWQPTSVAAIYDPLTRPNNQYGIHVADLNDLGGVASLVNSNGGDWGYITLVVPESDRNSKKWQEVFDDLRKLHLIPLIRLAGRPQNSHWAEPDQKNLVDWIGFLNSLNWPTENRYIILFNEPNHAKEWGNTLNPEGYAEVAVNLINQLKSASPDFFVMLSGFDVSAASDGAAMDAAEFLGRCFTAKPQLLDLIDGWVSHAYPNPGFSGSPWATGRGSLRSYQWELALLKQLGLKKNLPVFITETGWQHSNGKLGSGLLSPDIVGQNLVAAGNNVWNNPQIVAVTPFIYNYQNYPFNQFSWRKVGEDGFYSFAEAYRQLPKAAGRPKQREIYELADPILPEKLVVGSDYKFVQTIKNRGQGILTHPDYVWEFIADGPGFVFSPQPLPAVVPGKTAEFVLGLKAPALAGNYRVKLALRHFIDEIPIEERDIEVIPPPRLALQVQLGWKKNSQADDVTVLVYGPDEMLVHKFSGLTIRGGEVKVEDLTRVVPGQIYRVVVLVPQYLPRQAKVRIDPVETMVKLKRLLPLDLNGDGKFSLADLVKLFSWSPREWLKLVK